MVSSSFKIGLTVVIFLALVAYHVTNVYLINLLSTDWFVIGKLLQLAFTAAGFYVVLGSQLFTKIILFILSKRFLGGRYEGNSSKVTINGNGVRTNTDKRTLRFEIKHTFLETTVSGISYDVNGRQVSSWEGSLFLENGRAYHFALHLVSDYGEFGVLRLSFDNNLITGKYWSGDQNSPGLFEVDAKPTESP